MNLKKKKEKNDREGRIFKSKTTSKKYRLETAGIVCNLRAVVSD